VEGTLPNVAINTASGQWKKSNADLSLDVDFSDNVTLSSVEYKVGSAGTWSTPTTNGTTSVSASGASYTTNWKILDSDWTAMPQGDNTIYFRAQDTSGNQKGYDDSVSLIVKKDTIAPTSVPNITNAASGSPITPGPDGNLGTDDDVVVPWFKANQYSIVVTDGDVDQNGATTNASGIVSTSCYYKVQDLGRCPYNDTSQCTDSTSYTSEPRTCSSIIPVTVGSSSTGAVCQTQGINPVTQLGYCYVYVQSYDLAGNFGSEPRWLNIDYTPPGAQ